MITSKKIYSFELSRDDKGHIALTAQQWPWSVLQVIPTTQTTFETIVQKFETRGEWVAHHGTDRTFLIVHVCSGDQGGKYPDRHVNICGQDSAQKFLDALKDCMGQAAVWYYTNVVAAAGRL